MDEKTIASLLAKLDGSGSDAEWAAAKRLRDLGPKLPKWLLQKYRASKGWKARSSCVYHAARSARQSEEAVALGKEALRDRSKAVRYRAAELLAWAQRKDALPALRAALAEVPEGERDDLLAAVDAIESGNHNYFIDREHTGDMFLEIE